MAAESLYRGLERRRNIQERRKSRKGNLERFFLPGKRVSNRRKTDPQFDYYVDVYSPQLFAALLMIVILSQLDAVLTYFHITRGGEELNPIMDVVLELGVNVFFPYKFILTAFAVFILCLHKNFRLVRSSISLIVVLYLLLTFYHVAIIYAS